MHETVFKSLMGWGEGQQGGTAQEEVQGPPEDHSGQPAAKSQRSSSRKSNDYNGRAPCWPEGSRTEWGWPG